MRSNIQLPHQPQSLLWDSFQSEAMVADHYQTAQQQQHSLQRPPIPEVDDELEPLQPPLESEAFRVTLNASLLRDLDIVANAGDISVSSIMSKHFQLAITKQFFNHILANPIYSLPHLERRYNDINHCRFHLISQQQPIRKLLSRLTPIHQIFRQLRQYTANSEVFKKFIRNLQASIEIIQLLKQSKTMGFMYSTPQFLTSIQGFNLNHLIRIKASVEECLDTSTKIVRVQPGVNESLDRMKMVQENLQGLLQGHLNDYLNQLNLQQCLITLVRFNVQGYQLKVQIDDPALLELINTLVDWTLTHQSEQFYYFVNHFTEYLNNQYMHLEEESAILQQKILIELINQILRQEPFFVCVEHALKMLDYNIGLALMMDLYRLTIPELVDGSCIHIDGGRHIISEQVKHYFVENDFHCTHNVTIVTGPNYSGKSVYLKQVSLIVYLCHCGLPVPARYSKVALFEVMATLFAGETLRTGLLKQTDAELMALEQITRYVGKKSLIVLDELGKNFKFDIGSSLFSSVLAYQSAQVPAPNILAATHYHQVLLKDFQDVSKVRILQMQVDCVDSQLTYQYRIRTENQASNTSMALEVFRQIGGEESLYLRSKEILDQLLQRLL